MRVFVITLTIVIVFIANIANGQGWSWARGNTGVGMDGWPVATDPAGNVFCGGITFAPNAAIFGNYSVPPNPPGYSWQAILAKYDGDGNFLWAKGTQNGDAWIINIASDINGNAIMFGLMQSSTLQIGSVTLTNANAPKYKYFVAKFDPSGNVLWATSDGESDITYTIVGGLSYVLGFGGIATDFQGNIYVTCGFKSPSISVGTNTLVNTDPSGNTSDILLAKYDPSGNVIWAKNVGGTKSEHTFGITATPAGDVYISGGFNSPTISFGPSTITYGGSVNDIGFIARYNSLGVPQWASGVSLSNPSDLTTAVGLASDLSSNVYLTGGFKGNHISYAGGANINSPTPSRPCLYLTKFDPNNNVMWSKTIYSSKIGTTAGTWGYCIATSFCGVVWVSGVMQLGDTVMVEGQKLLSPPNSQDPIFIASYNTNTGALYRAEGLQSGGDDQNGIACDASGNLFVCSDYWSTIPFTVAHDTLDTLYNAGELLYVAKYTSDTTQIIKHSTTEFCYKEGTPMEAPEGYSNYLWSEGSTDRILHATDTGKYYVLSINSCADISYDTFNLSANCNCLRSIFVPNTFTPNNDGHNDVFYPRTQGSVVSVKSFRVFNRWGEMLFERKDIAPNDISNAWDGSFKGSAPRPEVFVYVLEAICDNGEFITKKGTVTIVK